MRRHHLSKLWNKGVWSADRKPYGLRKAELLLPSPTPANSIHTLLKRMIGGWRQWLRIDSLIVMETASQTERDGKEKSGKNSTVVHGKFPLSNRDNFKAGGWFQDLGCGPSNP